MCDHLEIEKEARNVNQEVGEVKDECTVANVGDREGGRFKGFKKGYLPAAYIARCACVCEFVLG